MLGSRKGHVFSSGQFQTQFVPAGASETTESLKDTGTLFEGLVSLSVIVSFE